VVWTRALLPGALLVVVLLLLLLLLRELHPAVVFVSVAVTVRCAARCVSVRQPPAQ
jgi:hypothetical protein